MPTRYPKDQECRALLKLIQDTPSPAFLLPQIVAFIKADNDKNKNEKGWTLQDFEFWLNHFADLPEEEERLVRGKITGKYVPRENYQLFFPIGMGKHYPGSHFVAAHLSPDIDTTVASFIVWQEAFACKVAAKQHIWNLPGGAPDRPSYLLFSSLYGEGIFDITTRKESRLFCLARDLLTRFGFQTRPGSAPLSTLQHGYNEMAIVLVDEEGKFVGDWRTHDVERVGQVILLFKTALRAFETEFLLSHLKILSGEKAIEDIWKTTLLLDDFNGEQKDNFIKFLTYVVPLKNGDKSTFGELFEALNLKKPFLKEGQNPFHQLEGLILDLAHELNRARDWSDTLETALSIKEKVLGSQPHTIKLSSDLEEIRLQMQDYENLTVLSSEGYPIGIVRAKDIRENPLAVVSFCDFCNYDEVRLPSYITPISVIDHHKSELHTNTPPVATIGDAQSCNVIIAELLFKLHDPYSLRGKTPQSIKDEIKPLSLRSNITPEETMRLRSLLQQEIASAERHHYFIHPDREKKDYILCLNAILDDTDLLTKVSKRDVECTAALLARIETIETKKEALMTTFNDIEPGSNFAKKASARLLEQPMMKKIWQNVIDLKQRDLDENLTHFSKNEPHTLFADTKTQNGCCLVTQIKRFKGSHIPLVSLHEGWLKFFQMRHEKNLDVDLALFMISSVTWEEGAEDELVVAIAPTEKGRTHVNSFLHNFLPNLTFAYRVELINDISQSLREAFKRQGQHDLLFRDEAHGDLDKSIAWARIVFPAGLLNSRKSMISPYIPHVNG